MKKKALLILTVMMATPVFADALNLGNDPFLRQVSEQNLQKRIEQNKALQIEIGARDKMAAEVCSRFTGYIHEPVIQAYLEVNGASVYSEESSKMKAKAQTIDNELMIGPQKTEEDKACLIALKDFNTSSAAALDNYISSNRMNIETNNFLNLIGEKTEAVKAAYEGSELQKGTDAAVSTGKKTSNTVFDAIGEFFSEKFQFEVEEEKK